MSYEYRVYCNECEEEYTTDVYEVACQNCGSESTEIDKMVKQEVE